MFGVAGGRKYESETKTLSSHYLMKHFQGHIMEFRFYAAVNEELIAGCFDFLRSKWAKVPS